MPGTTKKRVALIGLGDIARKAYLPLLTAHPRVEPIFCTRNQAVLEQLAQQYRVTETYAELDDLIVSRPDAATVHSSTESHPQVVRALLEARIPVFVDKPLAYTLAETEALLTLSRQTGTPLFVGFNRRYAPLVSSLKKDGTPTQVSWHKNRVGLPDDARTFILDDFIHVVDGLRFLAPGPVEKLSVFSWHKEGLLTNVQVRWQSDDCLLTGGMNRLSGLTEERIEYYTPGTKSTVRSLDEGERYADGKGTSLAFGNWEPTLVKRGFVAMMDTWLEGLATGTPDEAYLDDIRQTHALCEEILHKVERPPARGGGSRVRDPRP